MDTNTRNVPDMEFQVNPNPVSPTLCVGKTRAEDTRKDNDEANKQQSEDDDGGSEMEIESTETPCSGKSPARKLSAVCDTGEINSAQILDAEGGMPNIPGLSIPPTGKGKKLTSMNFLLVRHTPPAK
jgi:hypothetical protein